MELMKVSKCILSAKKTAETDIPNMVVHKNHHKSSIIYFYGEWLRFQTKPILTSQIEQKFMFLRFIGLITCGDFHLLC